jgi:hypothetical protein
LGGYDLPEVHAQYFAELSHRYHSMQRRATWGVLVFSSSAFFTVVASIPEGPWQLLRPATTLAAAVLSAYSLVMKNQKMAAESADLFSRWGKLAQQYRQLWENMYDPTSPSTLNQLDQVRGELSKGATQFPDDKDAMSNIQDSVQEKLKAALAHAG